MWNYRQNHAFSVGYKIFQLLWANEEVENASNDNGKTVTDNE